MNAMKLGSIILKKPKYTVAFTCSHMGSIDRSIYDYKEVVKISSNVKVNVEELLSNLTTRIQATLDKLVPKDKEIDQNVLSSFIAGLKVGLSLEYTADEVEEKVEQLLKSLDALNNDKMIQSFGIGMSFGIDLREDGELVEEFESGFSQGVSPSLK